MGPVLPVCSPESGGARDPRRGTLLSIQDPSFQDRNFLWLLSLNACFRINLRRCASVAAQGTSREVHSEFSKLLAPGASGSCFFTVDEANFGTQLGTICYLPKDHDPAVPFHWQDGPGLSDLLCIPCHGFPSDWHLARALKQQDEEEAVRSLATIDAELLALLKHDETHESRRCLRLGSARRRRQLLSFAEAELNRRNEQLEHDMQKRQCEATRQLVSRGFSWTDIQEVLPYCEGSAVRCEAVLRVAFAKYRSSGEQAAAGDLGNIEVVKANRTLFGISNWLGGCPTLALQALYVAKAVPLEDAVAGIAKEQEARAYELAKDAQVYPYMFTYTYTYIGMLLV
ncbi:Uncharacterized protein SCF082_LOCUS44446 [Durusdinium trenchii]